MRFIDFLELIWLFSYFTLVLSLVIFLLGMISDSILSLIFFLIFDFNLSNILVKLTLKFFCLQSYLFYF